VFAYPSAYLRPALGSIYVLIALKGFCWVFQDSLLFADTLAALGISWAAAMWWTIESMHNRREFPYVSTWSGMRFWYLVLPAHVFATRPLRQAIKLTALHALLFSVAYVAGAAVGAVVSPR
jgi:hypothetical protein